MRQLVSLIEFLQNSSRKVDLVSLKIIPKIFLNYHLPVNQIQQILHKSFVILNRHLPEIDPRCEQRTQTLLHLVKSLTIRDQIEFLYFSEIGISKFLEDILGPNCKFNRS
jgi:hypothetical protein